MPIQMRRGIYDKFVPSKMVPGEWGIVLSGDPYASDGRAAYVCFAAGLVKRVATYEDMSDYFAQVKQETVEWIVDTANAGFKEEYAEIRDSAKQAEAERVANELRRVGNEATREANESKRADAEEARASAEEERVAAISDFTAKVLAGYFDGATFTPSVSDEGLLSWTNDKGLPNPLTIDIKGPMGNDGVVTQLAAGMFMLQIEGTDLMLEYGEDSTPPNLSIEDGCLMIEIGDSDAQA